MGSEMCIRDSSGTLGTSDIITGSAGSGSDDSQSSVSSSSSTSSVSPSGGSQTGETFQGTNANDVFTGTAGDDSLIGLGGDDQLCGGAGDDFINAGPGTDWNIFGDCHNSGEESQGSGRDIFYFASGNGIDQILDFQTGIDKIQLADGLNYEIYSGRDDGIIEVRITEGAQSGDAIWLKNLSGTLGASDIITG